MRRGDIALVDFEPARGAEVNKRRPAVIVSNEGANSMADELRWGVVNVVPLTSNTALVHPYQVLIPADVSGLDVDSKALCEQVTSVAVERFARMLGRVPAELMRAMDEALRIQLAL